LRITPEEIRERFFRAYQYPDFETVYQLVKTKVAEYSKPVPTDRYYVSGTYKVWLVAQGQATELTT
jgi:hypothetical protein